MGTDVEYQLYTFLSELYDSFQGVPEQTSTFEGKGVRSRIPSVSWFPDP